LSAGLLLLGVVRRPFRFAPALSATATRALVPLGLANLSADVGLIAPRVVLPLMVTNLLGAESGAHFFIGFFVGVLLLTAVQALATSLFNEGSRDAAQLARAARHALLLALLVSGAGAAFLTVAGRSLLLVFGQDYADDSSGLLTLVSLAAVPAAAMYVLVATLRVRRATRAMLAVAWTGCAATLTLSFVLLPDLGIAGAGIGMLAGQSIGAAAAAVAVLRVRALV
jgi:O-antigen/teichoic acid export membrane protein